MTGSKTPLNVSWAFIIGVTDDGEPCIVDWDLAGLVQAKRPATLDDIYAACVVLQDDALWNLAKPDPDKPYVVAFLVFQYQGVIAASPDVFEEIIPMSGPSAAHMIGAIGVIQSQIIAQRAADLAAQVAVQATLSVLRSAAAEAEDEPQDPNKSKGGLYIA